MHPIHDVDVLLLLATALASKRRPAELVEIIAAADFLQGSIPAEAKLSDSLSRLSAHGLIAQADEGLSLTPEAQKLIEARPKKLEPAERLLAVREKLALWKVAAEFAVVEISAPLWQAAIIAHRAAAEGAGKNLLVAKPKPADSDQRRPGQRQRKPFPGHRRRD
ncbi:hypothetical protein [Rhodocyclus tenuis]|uniref:hypothetical protein n=1 Tax=Rhodocyclus tenuis TaxID=1066 RepID=UPI0019073457|nr:hypothetical protein [Rhodocyclus tenuis]MBK1681389.1 hypothetical protein [Rhodocyclus tenuis]